MIDGLDTALADRYRIEHELGEGGMATVYLAEDLKHGRKVALKVLKPELAAVVGADRFLAEIETTAHLQHPHILPLFDSGEAAGLLFYVMPYVEGESLRERLERERELPVEEAVGIAEKVLSALQYAHDQGVIHRDVKPGNVLVSHSEPLVADFGIALAVRNAGSGRITETGLSLGTPQYMSPEQAAGERSLDKRTDVYALGCVLYEMLTGQPPFEGPTAQAVLGRILTGEADPVREHRRSVPVHVEAAIHRALERLPADRFDSAAEFARALRDPGFRHGDPVRTGAMAGSWRRSWVPVVFALLAGLALGAAVVAPWNASEPAVVKFELTMPPGLVYEHLNGVNLTVSPDGSVAVLAVSRESGDLLHVRRLAELTLHAIPGTEGGRNPRFSPDGGTIAFTAQDRLLTVRLDGAPPRVIVPEDVPSAQAGLAWAGNDLLYFTRGDGRLWAVAAAGGEPRPVTPAGEADREWPDALPGGRGLLFTRDLGAPGDDRVELLDLETGESDVLFHGAAMARYAPSGHVLYADGNGTLMAAPMDAQRLEVTGPARPLLQSVQVNAGSASQFAISANGTLIFQPAAGVYRMVQVARDGTATVVDSTWELSATASLSLSPRGDHLALEIADAFEVWVKQLPDGPFTPLSAGETENARRPVWSRDGRHILYVHSDSGPNQVRRQRADGSSASPETVLTPDQPVWEVLAADDSGVVVVRVGDTNGRRADVGFARPGQDSLRMLLRSPSNEHAITRSPDGRWIAYVSDVSGTQQVYVRPFPDADRLRIQASIGGGSEPLWSNGGSEIFYRAADGRMTSAAVQTEPEFRVLRRTPLFDARPYQTSGAYRLYDVTGDDERFFMIAQQSRRAEVVMISNWLADLNRIVAPN